MKNWQTILLCVCVAVLLVWLGRSCGSVDSQDFQISDKLGNIKTEITRNKSELDSIKSQIPVKDTAQKKAHKRWEKVKKEAFDIPKCDTIIRYVVAACDSALVAKDSLNNILVSALAKAEEGSARKDTLIKIQDKTITDLTKEVKKEKRKKKFWKAVTIIAAGVLTGIYISK